MKKSKELQKPVGRHQINQSVRNGNAQEKTERKEQKKMSEEITTKKSEIC